MSSITDTMRRIGRPVTALAAAVLTLSQASCSDTPTPTAPEPTTTLTVLVATVGWVAGEPFTLVVDSAQTYNIGLNQERIIYGLRPGAHHVELQVRPDCRTDAPARNVVVTDPGLVQFDVWCFGLGRLDVITETSGAAPWSDHWLELVAGEWGNGLAANGTTTLQLLGGQYLPTFYPAPNCTSSSGVGLVEVYPEGTTELRLEATCVPAGTLSAALRPSGRDVPSAILWDVTNEATAAVQRLLLRAGGATDVMLTAGSWTGKIVETPSNCEATGDDPVGFTIADGQKLDLEVMLDCWPLLGALRVNLTSNGPTAWLSIDGSCETFDDALSDNCTTALTSHGATVVEMSPGSYAVGVTVFPPAGTECVVTPFDPVTAVIQTSMVTDVVFAVSCASGE